MFSDAFRSCVKSQNIIYVLCYPAVSHLCDLGMCCGNLVNFGYWPEQSEDWFLYWKTLQTGEQRQVDNMCNFYLWLELHSVFTISGYDDNVLSLVEMILGPIFLKKFDCQFDTLQCSMEIGPCFTPMACT